MRKSEIRAATSVFLRDTGVSRHWKQENLDTWEELAFARLVADLMEANADYYSDEQLITTAADGTYLLTGLVRTFARPLALAKKTVLTDAGLPYSTRRSRNRSGLDRTFFIRGGSLPTLTVVPREAATFGLEFVYQPTAFGLLAENATPDFPVTYHPLIAAEAAISATSDGGRLVPRGLADIAETHRQRFQAYLSRFNETGPIEVEDTD